MNRIKREPTPPGPITTFFDHLHKLHLDAGHPSLREIVRRMPQHDAVSNTSVHNAFRGPKLPSWDHVHLIVAALEGDIDQARQLWIRARTEDEQKDQKQAAANQYGSSSRNRDKPVAAQTRLDELEERCIELERAYANASDEVATLRIMANDLHDIASVWAVRASHYLTKEDELSAFATLYGHAGTIYAATFSRAGEGLATAGADTEVRIWNAAATRQVGEPLRGHTKSVYSVAFSDDGRLLATGSSDRTAQLWDAQSGRRVGERLSGHTRSVRALAFSPNGHLLATASSDGTVQCWDTTTQQRCGLPINAQRKGVYAVAFSPDAQMLALAGADSEIRFWDIDAQAFSGTALIGHTDTVRSLCFSSDGQLLASGGRDATIRLWDPRARTAIGRPLEAHTGTVYSVAFSPDCELLASGSFDETVRLWDVKEQRLAGQPLIGHEGTVRAVAFSPDGRLLASAGEDATVRLWYSPPSDGFVDQFAELLQALEHMAGIR